VYERDDSERRSVDLFGAKAVDHRNAPAIDEQRRTENGNRGGFGDNRSTHITLLTSTGALVDGMPCKTRTSGSRPAGVH
jgi:hypothetical protein